MPTHWGQTVPWQSSNNVFSEEKRRCSARERYVHKRRRRSYREHHFQKKMWTLRMETKISTKSAYTPNKNAMNINVWITGRYAKSDTKCHNDPRDNATAHRGQTVRDVRRVLIQTKKYYAKTNLISREPSCEMFANNKHKRPDYPTSITPKWHKVRLARKLPSGNAMRA